MEDIKTTGTQVVLEKDENVTNSDTNVYVHKFEKPYTYEDKTYTEMTFNFEKLKGTDLVAIENEMASIGQYAISPEISAAFLYRLAARAAGVGSDVIESLPIREFGKIKNKSRDFLIETGF